VSPRPILFGGGQENGFWPGTINVAAVAGFGEAMTLAAQDIDVDCERIALLAGRLESGLLQAFPGSVRNGAPDARVVHCVNICFAGIKGETLMALLSEAGVAASFGSACASMKGKPSHVLTAMGFSAEQARQCVRFGLGRFTTSDEIENTLRIAENIAHSS